MAGDSRNGRLIAAAVILMIGAVGGAFLAINTDGVSQHWAWLGTTMLVFGVPGMVGGVAAGAWSGSLRLPGREADGGVRVGFLGDALLGVIGGYAIFLLLPDKFTAPADVTSYAKTFALAAIGGVAARPIIEKLRSQFLAEQVKEAKRTAEQAKGDGHAVALTDQQLQANQPQEAPGFEKLRAAFAAASEDGRTSSFTSAREHAKRLRGQRKRGGDQPATLDEAGLRRAAEVFRALAEAGPHPYLHRFWGQLSYIHEALEEWADALRALDEAVKARDAAGVPGYRVYEFSRAQARLLRAQARNDLMDSFAAERDEVIRDLRAAAQEQEQREKLVRAFKGESKKSNRLDEALSTALDSAEITKSDVLR